MCTIFIATSYICYLNNENQIICKVKNTPDQLIAFERLVDRITDIHVSDMGVCAKGKLGIECIQFGSGFFSHGDIFDNSRPNFVKNEYSLCLADNNRLQCSSNNDNRTFDTFSTNVSNASNSLALVQSPNNSFHFFGLDDQKVFISTLSLTQPKTIKLGENAYNLDSINHRLCFSDDFGTICSKDIINDILRRDSEFQGIEIKDLYLPTQLAVGINYTCAIDEEKLKCWNFNEGINETEIKAKTLSVKLPDGTKTKIAMIRDSVCFIKNNELKCIKLGM